MFLIGFVLPVGISAFYLPASFATQSKIMTTNESTTLTIYTGPLWELPPDARIVLLLGDRSCDHLREIRRIAEFRGRAAYIIEHASELQPRWFVHAEAVGIVVGSTALQTLLDQVLARLRELNEYRAKGMLEGFAK